MYTVHTSQYPPMSNEGVKNFNRLKYLTSLHTNYKVINNKKGFWDQNKDHDQNKGYESSKPHFLNYIYFSFSISYFLVWWTPGGEKSSSSVSI